MKKLIRRQWRINKALSFFLYGSIRTKLLILLFIILLLVFLGTAVAVFLLNLSIDEAVWWSWTHIIDPG